MRKISLLTLALGLWLSLGGSVLAITPSVSIQQLPAYTNSNSFYLNCSALGGSSAQFAYKKESGSYQNFGGVIDLTANACQIQVTSAVINQENKYYFKVTLDGVTSDETSITYDNSGPGNVSGFYKEGLGDGYKLHYHTPSDSDFASVIIYRGDTAGFEADSSHQIAVVNAGGNSDMTYEDHSGTNKYYYIRAIDKAGNSSGLVGDTSTTTIPATAAPSGTTGGNGSVTQLPQQSGSVLGSVDESTEESESDGEKMEENSTENNEMTQTTNNVSGWVKSHKLLSGLLVALLASIGFVFIKSSKK